MSVKRRHCFIWSVGGDGTHGLRPAGVPGYGDDDEAVNSRGEHRTAVVIDVIAEQLNSSRSDGEAVWIPGRPKRVPGGLYRATETLAGRGPCESIHRTSESECR